MEWVRVDTKRAYERIRDRITTLEMEPGSPINDQLLARQLDMSVGAVQEALKLLAHESLVIVTPRHGLYVADVNVPDLQQLSEMRLALESLSARLAAERATPDDVVVLDALRQEQAAIGGEDPKRLLEVDHRFHQAIARASHNKYLVEALERLFGLSQRLWYLALPNLGFLPSAVDMHRSLAQAIRSGDGALAEEIMRGHVQGFYDQVRQTLTARD